MRDIREKTDLEENLSGGAEQEHPVSGAKTGERLGARNGRHTARNIFLIVIAAIIAIPSAYMFRMLVIDSGLADDSMEKKVREEKYPQYRSKTDKDGDGVDDQTDILESARAYIKTKPKYKSVYYATGYPDDEYGVCTDVIAFALKGAGYDLMKLMARDIAKVPGKYDLTNGVRDKAIDFRRVHNQNVYFRRHAIKLTTDLGEPEKWQGGDIVVFKNHVALVSDKRNHRGILYMIHLANPVQTRLHQYEQNGLWRRRRDIVGHYRVS